MNIYHIGWVQSMDYELNAVVVAKNEREAIEKIDLDGSYNSDIKITLLGIGVDDLISPNIICQESL